MKTCGIYRLQFPSGPYYIGQSQDITFRYSCHINSMKRNKHDNVRVQAVFNSRNEIPTLSIEQICSLENITQIEQQYLDLHYGKIECLNIAKCAEAPARGLKKNKHSNEWRKCMSEKMKLRIFTPEHKKRISESKKGKWHGGIVTNETRAKISSASKGRRHTEESKLKISKALMGHKPNFSKAVILINTGRIFESCAIAERETGAKAISRACRKGYSAGKMQNGDNMQWSFVD